MAAFILVIVESTTNAQQPNDVVRINTELVQTAATLVNREGKLVPGLLRKQFQLKVDGKPHHCVGCGCEDNCLADNWV